MTTKSDASDRASAWDVLYPRTCSLCGRANQAAICGYCLGDLGEVRRELIPGSIDVAFRAVLFDYKGRARQAVHALKYERDLAVAGPMARMMADSADELNLAYDLVVPIPIHYRRRCERGFNQSELLAESFPPEQRSNVALKRIRYTKPQVTLTYQQRLENLKGAFQSIPGLVAGKRILLLDDVATSGGTARAAADALILAGASGVGLIAFAGDV